MPKWFYVLLALWMVLDGVFAVIAVNEKTRKAEALKALAWLTAILLFLVFRGVA